MIFSFPKKIVLTPSGGGGLQDRPRAKLVNPRAPLDPLPAGHPRANGSLAQLKVFPMKIYLKKFLLGQVILIFALACFALFSTARAVTPAPDGGYPGGNTAEGKNALFSLTTGPFNTAIGNSALYSNTTAPGNTATGFHALLSTTTGEGLNTATGYIVLYSNTTGHRNTATGQQSMFSNTTGARNTATGMSALFDNTTGNLNTAFGWTALDNNQTASLNTALGFGAGYFLEGDNNIDIGTGGDPADSNTIRIGTVVEYTDPDPPNEVHPVHTATYIAGISGQTASGGVAVYINSDGKLGTLTSSARFKTEIKPMDESSEAILALKPVTFHYKHEIDPKGIP